MTDNVAELEQLLASVPTTEYVVFDVGETDIESLVSPPGLQTYEVPPDAVSTVVSPRQMVLSPEIEMTGIGLT